MAADRLLGELGWPDRPIRLRPGKQIAPALTNDAFADLQPAWSPDGRSIAFATDRFTSELADAVDRTAIASGCSTLPRAAVRQLRRTNAGGSSTRSGLLMVRASTTCGTPTASPTSTSLDLASGAVSRLTNLFTGVSGITETSPALSVAQRTGRLVYSVFRSNGYDIYSVDSPASAGQHRGGEPA